jgi:hypothetical protein
MICIRGRWAVSAVARGDGGFHSSRLNSYEMFCLDVIIAIHEVDEVLSSYSHSGFSGSGVLHIQKKTEASKSRSPEYFRS